ncbi:MAG: PASTA domain-containing protein [Thermodesulfobacteriota bacterium]
MIGRAFNIGLIAGVMILIAGVSAYLTLSYMIRGEDRVIVPELGGKEAVGAFEMLTRMGLNPKVRGSEYHDQVPLNHILSQEPAPGSEIKKGRDIRLVLSKGPRTIPIPNLKGVSINQARKILEENGLCAGNISRISSDRFTKDQVIAHSPGLGQTLEQGKCVDLLAGQGVFPKTYIMPDLEGLSFAEAVYLIEKMNLYVGEVLFSALEDRKENSIVDQKPVSGYRVTEGTPVQLVRNRKSGSGG